MNEFKERRKAAGMTQAEAAFALGCSTKTIQRMERDLSPWTELDLLTIEGARTAEGMTGQPMGAVTLFEIIGEYDLVKSYLVETKFYSGPVIVALSEDDDGGVMAHNFTPYEYNPGLWISGDFPTDLACKDLDLYVGWVVSESWRGGVIENIQTGEDFESKPEGVNSFGLREAESDSFTVIEHSSLNKGPELIPSPFYHYKTLSTPDVLDRVDEVTRIINALELEKYQHNAAPYGINEALLEYSMELDDLQAFVEKNKKRFDDYLSEVEKDL